MNGVTVRVNHTDTLVMEGWQKTARREYTHATGRKVKMDCNSRCWEVFGGPRDGTRWQTMHWAMYQAQQETA